MSCPHPAWKRDFEAVDNGRCPLCLSERVDALEAALATAQAERSEALMECNCAVLERDAALQRAEQAEAACSRKPDPPGGTMTVQQTMIGTEVTR